MAMTLTATFDGLVLRPDEPLELAPNTRVRITVEAKEASAQRERKSFLRTAQALELDGPPDWSSRLEEYLYDESRRSHE